MVCKASGGVALSALSVGAQGFPGDDARGPVALSGGPLAHVAPSLFNKTIHAITFLGDVSSAAETAGGSPRVPPRLVRHTARFPYRTRL